MLITILGASFLSRFLLADHRGYWFDELLSVGTYGEWNDNLGAALHELSQRSIHPPLFQTILYGWMEVFGDSERATRTLSNLLTCLATYLLYRLVRTAYSERVALATTLVFALSATATYYGGETRSYALTLALSTGSALAAMRLMQHGVGGSWRGATVWTAMLGLTLANAGLLLTHYFNGFFLAAQGIVLATFILRTFAARRWPAAFGLVVLSMAASVGVFAALWGTQAVRTLQHPPGLGDDTNVIAGPLVPFNKVIEDNFVAPRSVLQVGLLLAALVVLFAIYTFISGRGTRVEAERALLASYAGVSFALPLFALFALDSTRGLAHFFHYRHVIYVVPALVILVVLTVRGVTQVASRLTGAGPVEQTVMGAGLLGVLVIGSMVPGTLAATHRSPDPLRELAGTVSHIVRSDPDHRYLVVEANYAPGPIATSSFYLDRPPADIKPIPLRPWTKGALAPLAPTSPLIQRSDYLIVFFPHVGMGQFRNELRSLKQDYRLHFVELDGRRKHGVVVFELHPLGLGLSRPTL